MKRRAGLLVTTVRRRLCDRCRRRPGYATWQVCADGRKWRVLCWPCDKALNRLVLRWMRDPAWRAKCEQYEQRLARKAAE